MGTSAGATQPPLQREARAAAAFVVALVVATALSSRLTAAGVSLFWVPAAVVVLYLLRGRPTVTLPVLAGGRLAAASLVWGWDVARSPRSLVSCVFVVLGYGAAAAAVRRVRSVTPAGRGLEIVAFVAAFVVVAPAVVGVGSHVALALLQATPVAEAVAAGLDFAIGDAVAVVTFVPLALSARAGSQRSLAGRQVGVTLACAATSVVTVALLAGGMTASAAVVATLVVPLLVATALVPRVAVSAVVAATGVALAATTWSLPDPAGLRSVQLAFVVAAAAALVLSSVLASTARRGPRRRREVSGPKGPRVLADVSDFHAHVARSTSVARSVGAGLVVLSAVAAARTWDAALPLWVATFVPVAMLVATNTYSRARDRRDDHGPTRQVVEVVADLVTMVVLFGLANPLTTFQAAPMGLVVVAAEAGMRLPRRGALVTTGATAVVLSAMRLGDVVPWAVVPADFDVRATIPAIATLLLLVHLVNWAVQQLDAMREDAQDLVGELDIARQELSRNVALLEHTVGQLDGANQQLREHRRGLEEFADVVAHDLRSPVGTAKMLAEGAAEPAMTPEQRAHFLARIPELLGRAARLVDRLHEHARASTTDLHVEEVDLNELVREVTEDHACEVTARGAAVRVTGIFPTVRVDRVLFGQVLTNLLGNALRHGCGDDGGSTITFSGALHDDQLELTVADDGPGLPGEDATGLFTAGVRAGTRTHGIGLGLATCRRVVERHGGRIRAGAGPDGGAAFTITIPGRVDGRLVAVEPDGAGRARHPVGTA